MDTVNDGKNIRLDTPQAVKEALASDKGLYDPQTGEFYWEYNDTESIASTYVHLDNPNLLAVISNPSFGLFEDIVGGLSYTGYIIDNVETIIEHDEENAPLTDPHDEMFAQIASENGWITASPENVRVAVQSYMIEHEGEAPGKENGMDKAAEIAVWKRKRVPINRNGDDALVMRKMAGGNHEFVVTHGHNEKAGHWGHSTYYSPLASAAADLEGCAISASGMEVVCPDFWYRDDTEFALEEAGLEVSNENVDAALEALDLDGEPVFSDFHDRLTETGSEMIADAVNNIGSNDGSGGAPKVFAGRGAPLKTEVGSMCRISQALSADGSADEHGPSFTSYLSQGPPMMNVSPGYIDHSMSRHAAEAYEDGEMPKSKWTKKAVVAAIQSYYDEFDMLSDPGALKGMRKDEVFERLLYKSSRYRASKLFSEADFCRLDEDAVCESFRPMSPTKVVERDTMRRQAIEKEQTGREAMRAVGIEQLDRHRAYREEHGFASDTVTAFAHEHPECCQERVSRKGDRVLSYVDYLGHEQVCLIGYIRDTHLYGFDATEPDSFDKAIECRQLHSARGMRGDDRIILGGEARTMKAVSAEMTDGTEEHDIGLDAR